MVMCGTFLPIGFKDLVKSHDLYLILLENWNQAFQISRNFSCTEIAIKTSRFVALIILRRFLMI